LPRLFGTSGIRGVYGETVTPALAAEVGLAVGTMLGGGLIVVGHDPRTSWPAVVNAFTSGLTSSGVGVLDVGLAPTPSIAYTATRVGAQAAASVTASHNPPMYTGIKLFDDRGVAYGEELSRRVEEIVSERSFRRAGWDELGTVEEGDITPYLSDMASKLDLERRWRVSLDLMNGATCVTAPRMFGELGCLTQVLNGSPVGLFPSGRPEPTGETLRRLSHIVSETGSEVGFAYDGDGDRMSVVGPSGYVPSQDRVLASYAAYLVESRGGGLVVTHMGASMCVERAVEEAGGRVLRTRVGDVAVAEAVLRHGAVFGGEPIGAWIHPELHLCPDGVLSSVMLLKALEETGQTLREFVSRAPEYPTVRCRVPCSEGAKPHVMERVREELPTLYRDVEEVLTVDGVRVGLSDGWVLVRPSGTEPMIRITCEAEDGRRAEELMQSCRELVSRLVREVGG